MFCKPGFFLSLISLGTVLRMAHGNQCLTMLEEVTPKRVVHEQGQSLDIKFELSRRITQRLASRIMQIFLIEVLGYSGISIVDKDDQFDTVEVFSRLSESSKTDQSIIPETMVNMEVWIPAQMDTSTYLDEYHVKECGSIAPPGYFGWFVPQQLWRSEFIDTWHMFASRESSTRFDVDDETLNAIQEATIDPQSNDYYCTEPYCQQGFYIPDRCASSTIRVMAIGKRQETNQPCALLLASHPDVTGFIKHDIDRLKLYVKVAWVGPKLKNLSHSLMNQYVTTNSSRSLAIFHWMPSDLIPNDRDFVSVAFPRCKYLDTQCKYDANKLVKLVWAELELIANVAYQTIQKVFFTAEMYEDLLDRYNNIKSEEKVACDWLKDNLMYVQKNWKPHKESQSKKKPTLTIGGIFPMTETIYKARSIVLATKMAKEAINANDTLLTDYNLSLMALDGQCKSEMVMKSFIDYVVQCYSRLIGILGPACSETIEPLVGISKQYNTMVISYSAEGSSFDDRIKYPYFFRTIGENKQYKHVYLELFKRMNWHRVAALTEDGQKYTEYMSHMQDYLQENGITFVDNAKYPRERDSNVMYRYLENLKKKRAKIIIADVYDEVARQAMCGAYKLQMSAYEGYVWFLPLWLSSNWYDTDFYNKKGESVPCSTSEMLLVVNGYLGISHAYYASDDEVMQENITVSEWRKRYEAQCREQNQPPSDYAGYAYDATWTYAYAMDQLLRENNSHVYTLHSSQTTDRLMNIISRTDFNGVSGRIKFLGGASRISIVEIIQHFNNESRKVGYFYPNVSETHNEIIGGTLDLNISAIVWLSPEKPDDGFEPPEKCVLASFAELLNVTCEVAIIVTNVIGFGCLGILLIVGFFIVKKRYDEKVRLHERYIKSLGIDLLQTDTSDLDKWEIPRECVVINRKLGEGAFGTVYGGEAFFPEKGWLAVAVKTLKVGSSTEEKLDFLSEVEVMKRFEHKNIIKLLGVCIKSEPAYTVMEFMLYGDLKTYLLARRHLVNDRNYEDSDEISSKKLTAMALDVARALSYLAQLRYVHRDIASRNCLVNAQRIVKLGDFGMTRPMYENDYYKFNRKGMLPVRWMAPESLGLGVFTPASDVWSYGVLLYEIITFGSFPFQGLSNNEVLDHVKSGNTITIPSGIKASLENLIRWCWKIDHKARPSAPEIVDFLATNPRLLSPCLDVPLASVQLEHTGQIDIQLPEKFRKFSLSLNKSTRLASVENNEPLLMRSERDCGSIQKRESNRKNVINAEYDDSEFAEGSNSPLLESGLPAHYETESKYLALQKNNNRQHDDKLSARYVNIQPGFLRINGVDTGDVSSLQSLVADSSTAVSAERHDPLQDTSFT